MKKINYILLLLTILIVSSCSGNKSLVTQTAEYQKLKESVDTQTFIFAPNYIIPSGELQSKYLSPGYFVTLTKDEIIVNLPYLGMTTSTNFDGRFTGYDFTSKKYIYNIKSDKKNNWLIDVNFKDYKENLEMTMKISPKGKATVTLVSFSRQQVTFTGKVE